MVKIICPKCQKPLEEEYKFCIFCGTPLENQPRVTVESEAAPVEVARPVAEQTAPKALPEIPKDRDEKPTVQHEIALHVAQSPIRKILHVLKIIALVLWWLSYAGSIVVTFITTLAMFPIGIAVTVAEAVGLLISWSLTRAFVLRPTMMVLETILLSFGINKKAYNPYTTLCDMNDDHCYSKHLQNNKSSQMNYIIRLCREVFDLTQTARRIGFFGLIFLAIEKFLTFVFNVFNSLFGLLFAIPTLLGVVSLIGGIIGLVEGMGTLGWTLIGVGVGLLVVAVVIFLIHMLIAFLQEMILSVFYGPRYAKIRSSLKKEAAPWIELYGYEDPKETEKTEKTDSKTEKDEKKTEEEDDFDAEMEAVIAEVEAEEAAKKKKD